MGQKTIAEFPEIRCRLGVGVLVEEVDPPAHGVVDAVVMEDVAQEADPDPEMLLTDPADEIPDLRVVLLAQLVENELEPKGAQRLFDAPPLDGITGLEDAKQVLGVFGR